MSRPALRVVGWGPFPLPGERARMARAEQKAEEMMDLVQQIQLRSRRRYGQIAVRRFCPERMRRQLARQGSSRGSG